MNETDEEQARILFSKLWHLAVDDLPNEKINEVITVVLAKARQEGRREGRGEGINALLEDCRKYWVYMSWGNDDWKAVPLTKIEEAARLLAEGEKEGTK